MTDERRGGRKLPPELTTGLDPVRVGLLREDYDEAFALAMAEREAELARRLEILRTWYGVAPGPNCWRELCLVMAAERFPGFRDKAGRKPPKWTAGVLTMLAGEMLRATEEGAPTQEKAAQRVAAKEHWRKFLSRGQWKGNESREPWENLFDRYTRMPAKYRTTGESAYAWLKVQGTLDEWDRRVRDFLVRPE